MSTSKTYWGVRVKDANGGKWRRVSQFRKSGGRWVFWRKRWEHRSTAEKILKKALLKKKNLYGHVFEIKQPVVEKLQKTSIIAPEGWGSVGTQVGYKGVSAAFEGNPLIPHYGAIGKVKGPTTREAEEALLRAFEHHHLVNNGWPGGLGYHYAVAKSGRIYQSARGLNGWRGAHTGNEKGLKGDPNTWLGIVLLVGDNEEPTPEMLRAIRLLQDKHKTKGVRYHYEFDYTSCPGVVIPKFVN